jgi:hypothetical protein
MIYFSSTLYRVRNKHKSQLHPEMACPAKCYDLSGAPGRDASFTSTQSSNSFVTCLVACETSTNVQPLARVLVAGNTTYDGLNPLGNRISGVAFELELDSATLNGVFSSVPASSAAGPNLEFVGRSSTSGQGSIVRILAGNSDTSNGGNLRLDAGISNISGNGGVVTINGGTASTGAGGNVLVNPGNTTNGQGGNFRVFAGSSNTGNGGNVRLLAGSSTTSGDGGFINIDAGTAITGNGGSAIFMAGNTTTGNGGDLILSSGGTSGGGVGGVVDIYSTDTSNVASGDIRITSGDVLIGAASAGDVIITGGSTNINNLLVRPGNIIMVPGINPLVTPLPYVSGVGIRASTVGTATHFIANQANPPTIVGVPFVPPTNLTSGSSDMAGQFLMPAGPSTITITFYRDFGTLPFVVVSVQAGGAITYTTPIYVSSMIGFPTTFTVTNPAGNSQLLVNYMVIGPSFF